MGDTVQTILERMVPELEDLQQRGIFSEDEIRTIVRRRRDFEYAIAKRTPDEADYSRALEYELTLEALRRARKERLGLKRVTQSDHASIRRAHFIFERACRRFRMRASWWLQWLDFCLRTQASKAAGRVVARALQLHPHSRELWLQAAAFEFDRQRNMSSARALMQRALRANKGVVSLWLAYFRMECLYILRMKGRRLLLGLPVASTTATTTTTAASDDAANAEKASTLVSEAILSTALPVNNNNTTTTTSSDDEEEEGAAAGGAAEYEPDVEGDEEEEKESAGGVVTTQTTRNMNGGNNKSGAGGPFDATNDDNEESKFLEDVTKISNTATAALDADARTAFFAGAVPRLVYKEAARTLGEKDLGICLQFLATVDEFDDVPELNSGATGAVAVSSSPSSRPSPPSPAFPALAAYILEDIASRFSEDPRVWKAMAIRPLVRGVLSNGLFNSIGHKATTSTSTHQSTLLINGSPSAAGQLEDEEEEESPTELDTEDLFVIDTNRGDTTNNDDMHSNDEDTNNSSEEGANGNGDIGAGSGGGAHSNNGRKRSSNNSKTTKKNDRKNTRSFPVIALQQQRRGVTRRCFYPGIAWNSINEWTRDLSNGSIGSYVTSRLFISADIEKELKEDEANSLASFEDANGAAGGEDIDFASLSQILPLASKCQLWNTRALSSQQQNLSSVTSGVLQSSSSSSSSSSTTTTSSSSALNSDKKRKRGHAGENEVNLLSNFPQDQPSSKDLVNIVVENAVTLTGDAVTVNSALITSAEEGCKHVLSVFSAAIAAAVSGGEEEEEHSTSTTKGNLNILKLYVTQIDVLKRLLAVPFTTKTVESVEYAASVLQSIIAACEAAQEYSRAPVKVVSTVSSSSLSATTRTSRLSAARNQYVQQKLVTYLSLVHVSSLLRMGRVASALKVAEDAFKVFPDQTELTLAYAKLMYCIMCASSSLASSSTVDIATGTNSGDLVTTLITPTKLKVERAQICPWVGRGGGQQHSASSSTPAFFSLASIQQTIQSTVQKASSSSSSLSVPLSSRVISTKKQLAIWCALLEIVNLSILESSSQGGSGEKKSKTNRTTSSSSSSTSPFSNVLSSGLLAGMPITHNAALRLFYVSLCLENDLSGANTDNRNNDEDLRTTTSTTTTDSDLQLALIGGAAAAPEVHESVLKAVTHACFSTLGGSSSILVSMQQIQIVRRLFEVSTAQHGQRSVGIWLLWLQFEREVSSSSSAASSSFSITGGSRTTTTKATANLSKDWVSDVYDRACRTLSPSIRGDFAEAAVLQSM